MTTTSEDLLAVVRVHADRVHDAVRRLGCSPLVALEVVTESALDLVAVVGRDPAAARDPVGWWFARAWDLGQPAAGDSPDLPLGGGLLSADHDQQVLAEVLEQCPERDRMALLLRDSYALAEVSLGAALDLATDPAMEVVGHARLAFLQALEGQVPHTVGSHRPDLPALVRLAEGGQVAARDATTRRHVQSCTTCQSTVRALERAHLLLAGLTVVALPNGEREVLLSHVEPAARAALVAPLVAGEYEEEPDPPRRLLSPLVALLLLGLAVLVGLGSGVLLSRNIGPDTRPLDVLAVQGAPEDPPQQAVAVNVGPPRSPDPLPSLTVSTVPPSPRVQASRTAAAPSPSPRVTGPAVGSRTLTLDQTRGPNGAFLTVRGTGWPAQQQVRLDYLDRFGRVVGSGAVTTTDATGAFAAIFQAQDPTGLPGRHQVRAISGVEMATTPYDAT